MTLTNPLQGMFIGMFSGLSSAAVVMVGKRLGSNERKEAYGISKYLMKIGLAGSVLIGVLLALLIPFYVQLFQVEAEVKQLTTYIVYALAIILFAKITNMILGGGILRSGGNTHYTLISDLIGTWMFGVPLGLITAFVFHLPIYQVYFVLSLEEVVRVLIGLFIFKRKIWMNNVTS
jgi:Na+-driven multidrug efflux pump